MDINELRYMQGKLVTLQLKTPWIALMYQTHPTELAATLAVARATDGKIEPYGPQQFLANVKYELKQFGESEEFDVQAQVLRKTHLECLVVQQRGPDGSNMEILVPADEVSFVTLITEKPPERGHIIRP